MQRQNAVNLRPTNIQEVQAQIARNAQMMGALRFRVERIEQP